MCRGESCIRPVKNRVDVAAGSDRPDDGVRIVEPDAFPYLLINLRHLGDDRVVAERVANEFGVAVQPGSIFGGSTAGFVRINLGASDEALRAGVEKLAS